MAAPVTAGDATGTWGRVRPGGRAAPLLLAVAAACLYAAYALLRLRSFRTSTYDLVIFDQAVRSYSRLNGPIAPVKGVHNGFGPHFSILGDHFSPILALIAPFYRLHDGPATLLVAQSVLFALAIVPIWAFTARRLGSTAALCASLAYALSWPIAEALRFDFHEVAFAPLLTAVAIERFDAGRRWQAAVAAVLLLLVKEDAGLLITGFGLYLLALRPRTRTDRAWALRGDRPLGMALVVLGLVTTPVASRVLVPAFGGNGNYYFAYGAFGPDMKAAALHLLTHPWDAVKALGTPPVKLGTMTLLVLPLLALPLVSPLTLVVVPPLLERMLSSKFDNWWAPHYHYNAFLVATLVLAAVDGATRVQERAGERARSRERLGERARSERERLGVRLMAGMLAGTLVLVPFFAFRTLADGSLYVRDARARAAAAAVSRVPSGVEVEAVNHAGPALSGRARVLLWDRTPRWADWVVGDVRYVQFPFESVGEQRDRVALLERSGYRTVFARDGYVVLHR
ncbi:DUF2079 domain-containing protein [Actinomadura rupiterrae]|uniref:DUF2079 domain-containing protein n=1 Tax=Actinomadura rupiterrae TaxID=559627 RepID=UPI0020A2533A|nr:DUF2079 domain-containing protein [Actinomadura rupiterrae]MCP2339839.1 putative membrane protein [Actinomadura rupiterrae]